MRCLRYEIFPIRGDVNYIADIGSRWGNRFNGEDLTVGASTGPGAVLKVFLGKSKVDKARSKCVLRLPQSKVHPDVNRPDIDAQKDLMLHMDTRAINLEVVRGYQDKSKRSRPKGLKVGEGTCGATLRAKSGCPGGPNS